MKKNYVEYVIMDCPILGKKVVRHYFDKNDNGKNKKIF